MYSDTGLLDRGGSAASCCPVTVPNTTTGDLTVFRASFTANNNWAGLTWGNCDRWLTEEPHTSAVWFTSDSDLSRSEPSLWFVTGSGHPVCHKDLMRGVKAGPACAAVTETLHKLTLTTVLLIFKCKTLREIKKNFFHTVFKEFYFWFKL